MSMRLTNPDEKQSETVAVMAEKNAPMSGYSQKPVTSAKQSQAGGRAGMSADEIADLLARLQDLLASWPGSQNRIDNPRGYVMAAFPIPSAMTVSKVTGSHGNVFTVNDLPVVDTGSVMASRD